MAQSEHPDRIVLLDLDAAATPGDTTPDDTTTPDLLAQALASGEPQLAAGRTAAGARLARVSPGLPVPAGSPEGWRWSGPNAARWRTSPGRRRLRTPPAGRDRGQGRSARPE
ncbi:hypothetical protein GXW82_02850 [Streptacidiphilus sp. 4-A2]|nr:hypothetical protein [Streptacidiphilus sp. 4-A2]